MRHTLVVKGRVIVEEVGKHNKIKHAKAFGKGHNHINGIEGFWSYAKERFHKYHGINRNNYLQYIKEMEFRFNNRDVKQTGVDQYQNMAVDLREFGIVAGDASTAKSRVDERLIDLQKILSRKRVDVQKVHDLDDMRDVARAYGLSPLLDAYDLKKASTVYK